MRKKISILASISLLFIFSTIKTYATPFSFSISPSIVHSTIKPGKAITQVYNIYNYSDHDKMLIARVVPFDKADQNGNPNTNVSLTADWLKYFSLSNSIIRLGEPFEVKAHEKEQLILNTNIPEDTTLKDIYATILVSTYNNSITPKFHGSDITATIGSNLLISISQTANPQTSLKIIDFNLFSDILFKIGDIYMVDNLTPITFQASAQNEGDRLTQTNGLLKIYKKEDQPLLLEAITPQNIIAKSIRVLSPKDKDKFIFTPSLHMIGKYTTKIEIQNEATNANASITIILLPLKFLAIFIFVSLILYLIIDKTVLKDLK